MARRKRGGKFGTKLTTRVGPYFRRYAVSVTRSKARGGWTSQGFKFGRLTANTTTGRYSYDTPGRGSYQDDIPEWIMRRLPTFLTKQPERGGA
jgi:hypothetical protein